MAKEKKFVESITDMEVDFPQWYTDVVKKADLTAYSSLKGCMITALMAMPSGSCCKDSWMTVSKKQAWKMYTCPCSFPKACCRRKRTM